MRPDLRELADDGQVEMSDEGIMTDDIENCLTAVFQGLKKCDLPVDEVIAWCAAMLLICVAAQAQFESASVLGFVKDQSEAAVANANVTLTNIATGITRAATREEVVESKRWSRSHAGSRADSTTNVTR